MKRCEAYWLCVSRPLSLFRVLPGFLSAPGDRLSACLPSAHWCLPSARLVLSLDTPGAEHRHIGRRRSGGFIPVAAIQTVYGGCPVYYGEGLPGSDNLKSDGSRIAGYPGPAGFCLTYRMIQTGAYWYFILFSVLVLSRSDYNSEIRTFPVY